MAFLQGKTPIGFLQELCTKRGITPQYDLIANEGAVHEPTFVFKVTAGEFIGSGKGPSKKKAKHNAALSVLNHMMGVVNGQTPPTQDYNSYGDECVNGNVSEEYERDNGPTCNNLQSTIPDHNGLADGVSGNPVGELQEMTQKKLWPPPIYEFTSEQGPPHAREFICTVRLWKLQEQGIGKSKKLAKGNAAFAMLQLLQQGMTIPQSLGSVENISGTNINEEEYDEAAIPLPSLDPSKSTYNSLKEGKTHVQSLTPQASQKISHFYQTMKNATGKNLASLQNKPLNAPATNYCQMLQEIAEEQKFEVTYVDIQELNNIGQRQCLVQLSTMPVAVCHGVGPTTDEAHSLAAHNALQYLKIMTKKA